jgi:hypothetical protein
LGIPLCRALRNCRARLAPSPPAATHRVALPPFTGVFELDPGICSESAFRRRLIRDTTCRVARLWLWLLISGLCTMGCGPDRRECTGPHADFVVLLKLRDRPLPADTVVHVTYGGSGMENYALAQPDATHEVVFCHSASLDGGVELDAASTAAAGASGDDDGVQALRCELWTGGFAKLEARSASFSAMTYDLSPRERQCTVTQTIVLDSPDGG